MFALTTSQMPVAKFFFLKGCLYKHEMPTDPAMLDKLGLRDIPRWYREKYGLPSLLPPGHHHPRSHTSHGAHQLKDRAALKAIQYASRSGANDAAGSVSGKPTAATRQKAVVDYPQIDPQAAIVAAQAQHARPSYRPANFPKAHHASHHKQTIKQAPGQQHHLHHHHDHHVASKKIDLLSLDPLQDYPHLDPRGGNLGESAYSIATPTTAAEDAERAQREGLVRSLQSLVPVPVSTAPPSHLPSPIGPSGDTKPQEPPRSRRLYQPRSPMLIPEPDQSAVDVGPFPNRHGSAATLSSPASIISKSSTQMTSPLAGPALAGGGGAGGGDAHSDPPTRLGSPSIHSPSSTSSSGSVKKAATVSGFPRAFGGGSGGGNGGSRARPFVGPSGNVNNSDLNRPAEALPEELISFGHGK